MVFRVTGGRNSHCEQGTKGKGGGGATGHCLSMEGIIKILQSFGGGDTRLISG